MGIVEGRSGSLSYRPGVEGRIRCLMLVCVARPNGPNKSCFSLFLILFFIDCIGTDLSSTIDLLALCDTNHITSAVGVYLIGFSITIGFSYGILLYF
jgi:hypothetical protein